MYLYGITAPLLMAVGSGHAPCNGLLLPSIKKETLAIIVGGQCSDQSSADRSMMGGIMHWQEAACSVSYPSFLFSPEPQSTWAPVNLAVPGPCSFGPLQPETLQITVVILR